MNRRNFLGNTALFTVPLMIKGLPIFAEEGLTHPFLKSLSEAAVNNGKILIVIQMNGGYDGLNMVIPLDKYSQLSGARGNVLIPQNRVLPLQGTSATGLHPSMTGIQQLFNDGKVNIVQGVSYPNPNFSHFRAQDILFTGANFDQTLYTGWLGRGLNISFPGFPVNYPTTQLKDPPAIQIGGSLPMSIQGSTINMGYSVGSVTDLQNVINAIPAPAPANDYGEELTFLRLMKDQSNAYTSRIKGAYETQNTLSTKYLPDDNYLAEQLKIVARLIGGGLTTPLYIVNHHFGFDSHSDQVEIGDHTLGYYADGMAALSQAVDAFQDDITLMGKSQNVVGMTFTEFGRRVKSNDSSGTDHGTAFPVIFFGDGVDGGIIGDSPILPTTIDEDTQVPMQFDFRQLYASVLKDWLGFSQTQTDNEVLNGNFQTIPIFNQTGALPLSGFSISASWYGSKAKIDFTVFDNDAQDFYEIERAIEPKKNSFEKIAELKNNSDNARASYTYLDEKLNADAIYYKVTAVAKNGKSVSSKIVTLKTEEQKQLLTVFPNPVTNNSINIKFFENITENVEVTIIGTLGEKLYYNQFNLVKETNLRFEVQNMFQKKNIYFLKISFGFNTVSEKILFV